MRLLVTGGAGFIGSHFVRHVLATGDDEVRVLDALTYAGNLSSLDDVAGDPRCSFVHGDITDRETVLAAMAGCDAVVHLAAETHVDRSLYDPDAFVRTNCGGTNVLCDVARQVGVGRFLHVSTDEVYGSRATGSFSEADPLRPTSPYSASKAASDLLALSYHASFGLPVVVTRSSNQYGPYQFPEKLVPLFVTNLLRGRRVPLYGDGRNVRDWLFVQDNCAALDLVLRQGEPGTVYNVAGGNELTNLELTDRLLSLTGADPSAVEQVADRPGHDLRYSVECDRVRALGWAPSTGLDDGLAQTVAFYRDRADWWEDMCFRSGSLLSTKLFARLMVPRYKRITDFLRQEFGTEFNQLDCDGNIHQLAPLWLDGGINVMFPVEAAHTDPLRLAQQLGTRGIQRGSFDKRALIEGPAAIDAELAKLRPLIVHGDVIPHTDHLVPPDVPFDHYVYYRRKKLELLGKPWREPGVRARPGQITDWRLLGPFDNAGNAGFHAVLPPETAAGTVPFPGKDGRLLHWQPYHGNGSSGYVNLARAVSAEPWCVAYAACEIYSPTECSGWFDFGSDDGLTAWLNGEPIVSKDVYRIAGPAQDLVPVHLRQGWNSVLCKVGQAEGEWGFHLRVSDELGHPWPGLQTRI